MQQRVYAIFCDYYVQQPLYNLQCIILSLAISNCCFCSPSYRLVSCCQILQFMKQRKQSDDSDNQVGVPQCVVPVHTPGLGSSRPAVHSVNYFATPLSTLFLQHLIAYWNFATFRGTALLLSKLFFRKFKRLHIVIAKVLPL